MEWRWGRAFVFFLQKKYRPGFLWGQLVSWFKQTIYDPSASLSADRRGSMSLPDPESAFSIDSRYATPARPLVATTPHHTTQGGGHRCDSNAISGACTFAVVSSGARTQLLVPRFEGEEQGKAPQQTQETPSEGTEATDPLT